MVRFVHTSDWQLGMTRRYLAGDAQALFTQARFEAIRALARLAEAEGCTFMVVAGDAFDSNQVDRQTVARALESLGDFRVPVYLLPANHDALDAASVYRSRAFVERRPPHVHVIADGNPVTVAPGVEIAGAPWASRRPGRDLAAAALAALGPAPPGTVRILAAHGAADVLAPRSEDPALISVSALEAALAEGRIHYAALGDRHSATQVGPTARIWYSGAPEPTDFDEELPGHALLVDAGREGIQVEPRRVGTWRFLRRRFDLAGERDVDLLHAALHGLEAKERTVLRLALVGRLSLRLAARLDQVLAGACDLFAAVTEDRARGDLAILAEDADFADLGLTGFARSALDKLRSLGDAGGEQAGTARAALSLLVRLAGGER